MDHLFQDMDWDASLACDSPLRGSSSYVGRVRDPVVEQSTVEGLLRRTLEKNTEKRPSYGQKKSADHCFKHVSKTEKGGTGNELQTE